MSDEQIRIYRFENNGMGGPTEKTIDDVLADVRGELEAWADEEFGSKNSIVLTIKTGFMKRSEYDALPEFGGY